MQSLHAFHLRFLGATNTKPARIKITSQRFVKDSVTISYDYCGDCFVQAAAYLRARGYNVVATAQMHDGSLILCDGFKPLCDSKLVA